MAIQTGLGDYVAIDDSGGTPRDLSDNITSFDVADSQNLLDSTTLSKSAIERLIGLGDISFSVSGVYDAASNKSHDVFKVKTGVRTVTYAIGGNTTSNPELNAECYIADYNISRGSDGALTYSATLNLSDGTVPEWTTVS